MNARGKVVVGYDGSARALVAVDAAAAAADAHGSDLEILYVWHRPNVGAAALAGAPMPNLGAELAALAEEKLAAARAHAEQVAPGIRVKITAVQGSAGDELVRASENARLLVVASRGHGNLQELLLGSVSHHCVLHAHCPVLVIPHGVQLA